MPQDGYGQSGHDNDDDNDGDDDGGSDDDGDGGDDGDLTNAFIHRLLSRTHHQRALDFSHIKL